MLHKKISSHHILIIITQHFHLKNLEFIYKIYKSSHIQPHFDPCKRNYEIQELNSLKYSSIHNDRNVGYVDFGIYFHHYNI